MRDRIVLLVGKSGSGKTSVCDELERFFKWKVLKSYTTREKRNENEDSHTFVSEEEFDLLTNICAYTVFDGHRYCATQQQVDESDIYVIDLNGLDYFRQHYQGTKIVIPIYLDVSIKTQYRRMKARGDSTMNALRRVIHDWFAFRKVIEKVYVHIDAEEELPIVVSNVYKVAGVLTTMTNAAEEQQKRKMNEMEATEDN